MELIKYEAARRALAAAQSIDEVKQISDKVAALQAYARQTNDVELTIWLAEIRLRAFRRIGEISKGLEKAEKIGGAGRFKLPSGGMFKKDTLKAAGISTSAANRCEGIAEIPSARFEDYITARKERKKPVSAEQVIQMTGKPIRRKKKIARLKFDALKLPGNHYHLFYADPPWRYYAGQMTESRRIENQYPTMELDKICKLPVSKYAANDSLLLLWSTSPGLADALHVIEAWGFQYRTCMVWVKPSIGAGQWVRQRHELLLIAAKGKPPVPLEANRPDSVIEAPRGRHSEKPSCVYDIIENAFPEWFEKGEAVELFARSARPGWTCWGAEAPSANQDVQVKES